VGFAALEADNPISLKYFIYVLVLTQYNQDGGPLLRQLRTLIDDLPILDPLRRYLGGSEPVEPLREMVKRHLESVAKAALHVCDNENLSIEHIVATMPATWITPFQRLYEEILMSVFPDTHPDELTIIYEPEAIGHWVLNGRRREFREFRRSHKRDVKTVVFVDFGGHTVVSSLRDGIANYR
jgi:hypothetical protein